MYRYFLQLQEYFIQLFIHQIFTHMEAGEGWHAATTSFYHASICINIALTILEKKNSSMELAVI